MHVYKKCKTELKKNSSTQDGNARDIKIYPMPHVPLIIESVYDTEPKKTTKTNRATERRRLTSSQARRPSYREVFVSNCFAAGSHLRDDTDKNPTLSRNPCPRRHRGGQCNVFSRPEPPQHTQQHSQRHHTHAIRLRTYTASIHHHMAYHTAVQQ